MAQARKRGDAITAQDVAPWLLLFGGALLGKKIWDSLFTPGHSTTMPETGTPTLNRSQLALIADRIWAGAYEGSWFWEDEEDMSRALLEIGNDADFYALFNIYGERSGPVFGDVARNLVETFTDLFNDEEIASLNSKLAAKGLTIRL